MSAKLFPVVYGAVTEYAAGPDGRRACGITWGDGPRLLVSSFQGDDRAVAEYLARAPGVIREQEQKIASLETELRALRAQLPPKRPQRLLGLGCIRQDPTEPEKIWILNTQVKGWSSFGVQCDGWDDLFRRYDVTISAPMSDKFGQYWLATPRGTAGATLAEIGGAS